MKNKILYLLFLLFPLFCQAEISKKDITDKIENIEKILSYQMKYPIYNRCEKWKENYWYLNGKLDAYIDVLEYYEYPYENKDVDK